MILVTGATGTIGRHVVELLLGRGIPVRAMTRSPERVVAADGLEVVAADFEDPASLRRAAAGVSGVMLITAPQEPTARHDIAMIDAARDAGVERVVKLSAIGTGERYAGGVIGEWHLHGKDALRDSGLGWTILRPSVFASNMLWWASAIANGAPIADTVDGARQGVVDPRDVSAAAAAALTGDGHGKAVYTLTGPEPISVGEQALVLGEVLGTDVHVETAPPPDAAWAAGIAWSRDGRNAVVTGDVARLLGRPPASFRAWAEDHRDAFRTAR
ncbi:NAD(P)H-binding protein [Catenuloplanes japonicus]|uniref:NAD(P)H-binding protein n=1 Tax=Catenuloplanes japonicus TaxID=33876 RepID=UPI0005279F72|nr:NAD(P)H-binding protein [Catenuloplanes japonicus]